MKLLGLIAGAALLFGAQSASAVTIANGSFELGTAPGAFAQVNPGDGNITGWTVNSGSVDYIGSYWAASNGSRSLDMSGGSAGQISQVINGLTDGQEYKVTFDIAGNPAGAPASKDLKVTADGYFGLYSFDTSGHSTVDMGWSSQTFFFVANGTSATLAFLSLTAGSYGAAL